MGNLVATIQTTSQTTTRNVEFCFILYVMKILKSLRKYLLRKTAMGSSLYSALYFKASFSGWTGWTN